MNAKWLIIKPFGFFVVPIIGFFPAGLMRTFRSAKPITRIIRIDRKQ